ncbi:MAG: helix-turn-helix domain-containing protein, partial [Eubacterium sp.]|nr:helix-turn-helix domain-containing protein [Eubacterium sp.]
MYSTGEVLDQYISDTLTSKNSVIQMLGIDRSSFYQILKGKRLPTSSQLRTLLDILNISESEKNHIRDIYMSDKLTTHSYNSRKNILKLLETFKADSENETIQFGNPHIVYDKAKSDVFNDKSDTKSTLLSNRHEINELIKHMLFSSLSEESDQHISLFIPIQLLTKTSFFETIELISYDSRSSHITYDHIINHPLRSNMIDNDFLADLTSYIGFLISSKANIRSYYNLESICDEGSLESLYPYYIFTNEGLLLLGSRCDTAVFTSDKVLISAYSSEFSRLLGRITPIIESIDSIEESVVAYLRSLPDTARTYYLSYNPGISYLATDELVEVFISPELQDLYKAHFHAFQHLDY